MTNELTQPAPTYDATAPAGTAQVQPIPTSGGGGSSTPADGSVTTAKIVDGAVTAAKLAPAALAGTAKALVPTATKTGAYAAAANEFVPVDATAGAVTITLPTAPADGTRIGAKKIDASTNLVTLARGGTDVFNAAGGSTSVTLTLQRQAVQFQYQASTGIWYGVASDLGLTALDARYDAAGAATSAVSGEATTRAAADALLAPKASPPLTGSPTAPTQAAADNSTKLATTAYADAGTGVETSRATTAEGLLAPKASPTLTGTPLAPTPAALDSTTKIATTAFVTPAIAVEAARALAAEQWPRKGFFTGFPDLVAGFDPGLIANGQAFVTNQLRVIRVTCHRAGFIRDVSAYVSASGGNVDFGVWDTGDTTPGSYVKKLSSGILACGAAGAWQTWDPGAGAIAVYAGQVVLLGMSADGTAAAIGRISSLASAVNKLPANFGPVAGGASPKKSGIVTAGAPGSLATFLEANLTENNTMPGIIARISDT